MSPQRIQRRRTRGWRAPEGVFHVGRHEQTRITVWGDQCGGTIIIPADMAHLVTIRDLDEMEPPC